MRMSEETLTALLHQACVRQRELCAQQLEYFSDRILATPLWVPDPGKVPCRLPECSCERPEDCR